MDKRKSGSETDLARLLWYVWSRLESVRLAKIRVNEQLLYLGCECGGSRYHLLGISLEGRKERGKEGRKKGNMKIG
jgi:hypothetical protein